MVGERILHLVGASLESRRKVSMTIAEALEHVCQMTCGHGWMERKHATDDPIGARLVYGIEVARLGCGPEGAHHNPRRVGAQMQRLAAQQGRTQRGRRRA